MQLTEDHTYSQIDAGDIMPDGSVVIERTTRLHRTNQRAPITTLVRLTVQSAAVNPYTGRPFITTFGENWGNETLRTSRERAEHMLGLVDHS